MDYVKGKDWYKRNYYTEKLDKQQFDKLHPANYSEAVKERVRRELKVDLDESHPEAIEWAVKKAKAKYKRELNGST